MKECHAVTLGERGYSRVPKTVTELNHTILGPVRGLASCWIQDWNLAGNMMYLLF